MATSVPPPSRLTVIREVFSYLSSLGYSSVQELEDVTAALAALSEGKEARCSHHKVVPLAPYFKTEETKSAAKSVVDQWVAMVKKQTPAGRQQFVSERTEAAALHRLGFPVK